jgi:hypothetical protein
VVGGNCGGLTDPCTMLRRPVCLSSVSKNVEGELGDPENERRECGDPGCVTLTSVQSLVLKLITHQDCDRVVELDGTIEVRDLVHVFDNDGTGRGVHSGSCRWESSVGLIFGDLSGITNAGTHRAPAFQECQRCWDPIMEGQLRGTVCRARDPRFAGCQVFGAYRLRIEPSPEGLQRQSVRGTVEGVLASPCR